LGEICGGSTPSTKNPAFWDGSIPWVVPTDVSRNNGFFISDTERKITDAGLKSCAAKLLPPGTVIMTSRATIADVVINKVPMTTNQGFINIICNDALVFNEFLAFWIKFNKKLFEARAHRVTFREISKSNFKNIQINLPPLAEQKAIAKVLRAVQEAKEARWRELALERERKAALMEHLFAHGTRGEPRKKTEIGEIPESWRVAKLGEIGKVITGTTPPTEIADYFNGPYMFITPGDIEQGKYITKTQRYLSKDGLKVSRQLPPNTVIVVCIGATIGKVAMTSAESAINQQINALIVKKQFSPQFVYYAIDYRSNYLPLLAGRAAVPIVNKSAFEAFSIPMPSLISEQEEIATILSVCDDKIAALEQELSLLEELFNTLLEELMTGRLSALPLVEDESAS